MSQVRTTRHSQNDKWKTPAWLFNALSERYGFTVDLCAEEDDSLTPRYGFEERRAGDVCWMNPPHSDTLAKLLAVLADEFTKPAALTETGCVVCLVPVRTSTGWWHDCAMKADQVIFVRGRLRFSAAIDNAPSDSAILVFGKGPLINRITATLLGVSVAWTGMTRSWSRPVANHPDPL